MTEAMRELVDAAKAALSRLQTHSDYLLALEKAIAAVERYAQQPASESAQEPPRDWFCRLCGVSGTFNELMETHNCKPNASDATQPTHPIDERGICEACDMDVPLTSGVIKTACEQLDSHDEIESLDLFMDSKYRLNVSRLSSKPADAAMVRLPCYCRALHKPGKPCLWCEHLRCQSCEEAHADALALAEAVLEEVSQYRKYLGVPKRDAVIQIETLARTVLGRGSRDAS